MVKQLTWGFDSEHYPRSGGTVNFTEPIAMARSTEGIQAFFRQSRLEDTKEMIWTLRL